MVREFSVDPKLVVTWAKQDPLSRTAYKFYETQFQLGQGRRISNYPATNDKWFELIIEEFQDRYCENEHGESPENIDLARTKMETLIQRWKQKCIPHEGYGWTSPVVDHPHSSYDEKLAWLDSALQHVSETKGERAGGKRVRAILSTQPHKAKPVLLCADNDPTPELGHKLWKTETTKSVKRDADELAEAVAGFLLISKRVIFIDPYIDFFDTDPRGRSERYKKSFDAFFRVLKESKSYGPNLEAIELIFGEPVKEQEHEESEWRQKLPSMTTSLPPGISVKATCLRHKWVEDSEHILKNRFILSEQGGIGFAHGLDRGQGKESLNLIAHAEYHELWNAYQKPLSKAKFVVEFTT